MAKSTRRPQQLYTIVMWILSIVFAGFLIGLGSLVIKDLPQVDKTITVEQFVDQEVLQDVEARQSDIERQISSLRRTLEDEQTAQNEASADYISAKETFDNWLLTRSATEASDQNPEVIARTRNVERLRDIERIAQRETEAVRNELTAAQRTKDDLRSERYNLINAARPEYRSALNGREMRVFFFRLALTLPLLLLGGWMVAKKRGSPYWPLYRGFVIFALFAFFVELVPYLPSYGGYVRYAVGIFMVVIAGHFIIRGMRRYMARKAAEEERSEVERRKDIGYETALKKIAAKTCPGCDRAIVTREGVVTDFCVHCGIRLQTECGSCGQRNVSFHKFCLSCGTPSAEVPAG